MLTSSSRGSRLLACSLLFRSYSGCLVPGAPPFEWDPALYTSADLPTSSL
ncbi:hypothetical protein RSAG8_03939, partial [Rhizoctonia solani AG-8 WAC10335]